VKTRKEKNWIQVRFQASLFALQTVTVFIDTAPKGEPV
jgi:hypothetical protein